MRGPTHRTARANPGTHDIAARLRFIKAAPRTVSNFVALAQEGFYDGTIFHRARPLSYP